MKRISVIGGGYVGLVTAACLAELGNRVACIEIDETKLAALKRGAVPFFEPDLEPMVQRHLKSGRLIATNSYEEGLAGSDFVFICVGTPSTSNGAADLSAFHSAYDQVLRGVEGRRRILVNKSTVPPGTTEEMALRIAHQLGPRAPELVSNPEFLREGYAVFDFMHPSRVVIGAADPVAAEEVASLYQTLDAPIITTDTKTAEMIKYASNAFLATKVSFANEIARICDKIGIDMSQVSLGIGLDPRIGKDFLQAGIGYGGSCLPKDTAALIHLAKSSGIQPLLLSATAEINAGQPGHLIGRLKEALGSLSGTTIGVLGMTFKPHTDDLRASPALRLVDELSAQGAKIRAYDPKTWQSPQLRHLDCFGDPYEAVQGCDAVVVATAWPEVRFLDLGKVRRAMRGNILADGRNALDPDYAVEEGFVYIGIGKGWRAPALSVEPLVPLSLGTKQYGGEWATS